MEIPIFVKDADFSDVDCCSPVILDEGAVVITGGCDGWNVAMGKGIEGTDSNYAYPKYVQVKKSHLPIKKVW